MTEETEARRRPPPLNLLLSGVHHTARPTWKLRDTIEFYRDVLGLRVVHAISARGWGPQGHPDFLHFFFDSGQGSTIAFFYYIGTKRPDYLEPRLDNHNYRATHTAWQVNTREELVAWFEAGIKPKSRFRLGTEHEKFAFTLDGHNPVPYEGRRSIRALLEGMQYLLGWEPIVEDGNIIGLFDVTGGGAISLEPGGQFELSGAPVETVHQTCSELMAHLAQVKEVARPLGVGFLVPPSYAFAIALGAMVPALVARARKEWVDVYVIGINVEQWIKYYQSPEPSAAAPEPTA